MKTYTADELKEILKLHTEWLYDRGGRRANLSGADLSLADLRSADLSRADLRSADLSRADLRSADLSRADLSRANLSGADLSRADLSRANLSRADLRSADLSRADLSGADLSRADLRSADLSRANLSRADLRSADLSRAEYNETTAFFALSCPEEGDFIAWKTARDGNDSRKSGVIVKLLVTGKRSSATTRKCRCSEAVVLEIIGADEAVSGYDKSFVYRKGETVRVDNFDEDRWIECSTGIHFFITRKEAENYN